MALKSFKDRNRFAVGIVSLLVAGGLIVFVFMVGSLRLFVSDYTMTGVFADSGGIRSGNDVRVAGVRVGQVTGVEPDFRRGHVIITWTVDDGVRLGRNTRAEVRLNTLLGGRYLKLSGPVGAPYMDDLPEAQRRVPLERTATPALVGEVLKNTSDTLTNLDTKTVDKVLGQLTEITRLRARGEETHVLSNVSKLADTLNEADPEIRRLLEAGERILDTVTRKEQQLTRLVDQFEIVFDALRQRRDELSRLFGRGNALVKELTGIIDRHERDLVKIIDDVNATVGDLGAHRDQLNTALAWAGPTFQGVAGIGGHGPWLEAAVSGAGPISPEVLRTLLNSRKGGGR
ncbi:MlaD family protein [Bailinhaonella thermotolerans]|uniref:MCE family protein n=1 Tax=Bailinhaonella thermotolerans TaxID=1070861 RepID=A0A3A4BHN4_9ACTN|nr:MlaD family protein [Bailinhaonella thermotolerans]RJL34312.1 MCE family protein [Bailinhaonella thermotolerans]